MGSSRLSFFPTPYPDEILYSVFARYHIRSGNTSPRVTTSELFNSPSTLVRADLPYSLDTLVKNLPLKTKYTSCGLIKQHTLYPFYAVFLPEDRASLLMEFMRLQYGGSIHKRVGIAASSAEPQRYFRFCSLCFVEDQDKYGEAYWHRLHQTPGVLVCPVHAVALNDSLVPITGNNRHEYSAATLENCPLGAQKETYSNNTLQKLLLLTNSISWLMSNDLPCRGLDWLGKQYTGLLIDKGLATVRGRVYQKKFRDKFLSFYGHELLEALGEKMDDYNCTWLFDIVGAVHSSSFHPVRHLLSIRFLTKTLEDFFTTNFEHKPFGEGPWPCLNQLASHYLKPVVTDLVISQYSHPHFPVGTFRCDCRFVYCRTGPDETESDLYRADLLIPDEQLWKQKRLRR